MPQKGNTIRGAGQTVYVQKGASNQFLTIEAASLINGLYIVQYASGDMVRTEKVMIQHWCEGDGVENDVSDTLKVSIRYLFLTTIAPLARYLLNHKSQTNES